jgi:hypothetical protein
MGTSARRGPRSLPGSQSSASAAAGSVVCRCGVEEGEGDEEKREKGCGPVGAKSSFHLTVDVNQMENQTEGQILRRELLPP